MQNNKSEKGNNISLLLGDALDLLATLEPGSVDCVCTDPPYCSGGLMPNKQKQSPKNKYAASSSALPEFPGDTLTQRVFAVWCERWLRAARRATKPGGWLYCFIDWRQYPVMSDCLQLAGWTWQGVIVWDKRNTRPHLGKHLQQCEFVLMATNGGPSKDTARKSPPGIWSGMMNYQKRVHMTEKPVELLKHILQLQAPGALVLDPFAGSGSTLVAAHELGLSALGFELSDAYYAIAQKRLEEAGIF